MNRHLSSFAIPALAILAGAKFVTAQPGLYLKASDVMTSQELEETGVAHQTAQQRQAFDKWLNQYTVNLAAALQAGGSKSGCTATVESTLSGEFKGWDGETIFKLDNGQVWEQAEYTYTYSYSYRPEVTIYHVSGGCRLKVEDEEETIMVRRIK